MFVQNFAVSPFLPAGRLLGQRCKFYKLKKVNISEDIDVSFGLLVDQCVFLLEKSVYFCSKMCMFGLIGGKCFIFLWNFSFFCSKMCTQDFSIAPSLLCLGALIFF